MPETEDKTGHKDKPRIRVQYLPSETQEGAGKAQETHKESTHERNASTNGRRRPRQNDRRRTAREMTRQLGQLAGAVRVSRSDQAVLASELLVMLGIIGLRALADYSPASSATEPGSFKTPKGQPSPMGLVGPVFAVFFILAIVATVNPKIARLAEALGAVMIVTLLLNSMNELNTVARWFEGSTKSESQA